MVDFVRLDGRFDIIALFNWVLGDRVGHIWATVPEITKRGFRRVDLRSLDRIQLALALMDLLDNASVSGSGLELPERSDYDSFQAFLVRRM